MNMAEQDPDELMQETHDIATRLLAEELPAGERLQDVLADLDSSPPGYATGFQDALVWMSEVVTPKLHEVSQKFLSGKREKAGAAKVGLVENSILSQAYSAVQQIADDDDDDEPSGEILGMGIIIGPVSPEQIEEMADGSIIEKHIFSCSAGKLVVPVHRYETLAVVLAPRVIKTFGEDLTNAEAFARWMLQLSMSFQEQGLRVVYVDAPIPLAK